MIKSKNLKSIIVFTDHPFRELRKVRPLPRSASDNSIFHRKNRTKVVPKQRTHHALTTGIPGKFL